VSVFANPLEPSSQIPESKLALETLTGSLNSSFVPSYLKNSIAVSSEKAREAGYLTKDNKVSTPKVGRKKKK